jgi:membrane associated rhomboid family serine protease
VFLPISDYPNPRRTPWMTIPLIAPTGSPVAHGAHIGGFLAGLLVAWLMRGRTQPSQE